MKVRDGFWVTEVLGIRLPRYIESQSLRCFVIRMRGKKPWVVLTNDKSIDPMGAAQFYLRRNLVEKVIQELLEDYSLAKLVRSAFDDNACWVMMTGFSYNLWLDFKMTVLGKPQTEILRRKLSTLIRQVIDVSAIVYYVREMLIVEFENPPPIMLKVLSALT